MNKNILIGIVVVLIVAAGSMFIANQQSGKAQDSKPIRETTEGEDVSLIQDNTSRYVEYSKSVFEQSSTKRRVLYFYANWCPICKPADEDFKANSGNIPENVVLIRVNYNDSDTDQEEKDLAKKYGITYQHTFVQIDSKGAEITKWNGGQTDELLTNIK